MECSYQHVTQEIIQWQEKIEKETRQNQETHARLEKLEEVWNC